MIYLCKPRNLSFINFIKDIIYTAFHIPERRGGEGGGEGKRESRIRREIWYSFYQTNEQINLSDYY